FGAMSFWLSPSRASCADAVERDRNVIRVTATSTDSGVRERDGVSGSEFKLIAMGSCAIRCASLGVSTSSVGFFTPAAAWGGEDSACREGAGHANFMHPQASHQAKK